MPMRITRTWEVKAAVSLDSANAFQPGDRVKPYPQNKKTTITTKQQQQKHRGFQGIKINKHIFPKEKIKNPT